MPTMNHDPQCCRSGAVPEHSLGPVLSVLVWRKRGWCSGKRTHGFMAGVAAELHSGRTEWESQQHMNIWTMVCLCLQ
ncbi:rCG63511 [Rattus norvegicus]|uniref:RCG63511 n=1 Tax=Rattus norvegicus TaxID=10116 RepID=A6HL99_RAT|nr:rCG63511 [Rattus norvegicus]